MNWPLTGLFVDHNSDEESNRVAEGHSRGQAQEQGSGVEGVVGDVSIWGCGSLSLGALLWVKN